LGHLEVRVELAHHSASPIEAACFDHEPLWLGLKAEALALDNA
jgi:hypothetical protein